MTFPELMRIFSRRWVTIGVVAVLTLTLAVLVAFLMPSNYTASAKLVVSPVSTNPNGASEDVNIRTEREILASSEVARRAADQLGVPVDAGSYLLSGVDVAAPQGSQVLEVTVSAKSPQAAADGANALADAYLSFRAEGASEVAQRYIAEIDDALADLDDEPDGEAKDGLVTTLRNQRQLLQLGGADPGRIIGAASAPSSPAPPGPVALVAGGLGAGLLFGLVLALVRERVDTRVRVGERLEGVMADGTSVVDSPAFEDAEGWRRAAFLVDRTGETARGVGVVALNHNLEQVTSELVLAFASLDEDVVVISPPHSLRPSDSGAPSDGIVLRALSLDLGLTEVAVAARRVGVLVVAMSPHTRLKEVRELVTVVEGVDLSLVVVVVPPERPDRSGPQRRHAGRRAPVVRFTGSKGGGPDNDRETIGDG